MTVLNTKKAVFIIKSAVFNYIKEIKTKTQVIGNLLIEFFSFKYNFKIVFYF